MQKDKYIYLGFLALVLLFFSRFLTGELIFAFKDLSRYFYPLRYLMVAQVKSGLVPLWNPYVFCGFPLLATLQIGFFYPLTIIHYLLPFNLAFNYYIIIHYFLAACFMFLLLQHYSLSKVASFFGGVIFAFSGYLLSVSNMNTSLSSVIWLPLTLLVFDRMVRPVGNLRLNLPAGRHGVAVSIPSLAVLIALQFLGGEPTIIYITVFFLVAYALSFAAQKIKSLIGLGFAGLIALGLVAVQLLPFLELARLSDRVVRTTFDLVTFRSLPLRELLNFIFPFFFGNPAQFGSYTEALLGKINQDWLISPYLGILPLVFIFLSFITHKKLAKFFAWTVVWSLLLAFGKYTPLYRWVFMVPGVSMIRFPVKYLFLTTFSLTILASFGFDSLLRARGEYLYKIWQRVVPVLLSLIVVFVLVNLFQLQIFDFFVSHYKTNLPFYFYDLLARLIGFNLGSLAYIMLYLFAFVLLLWLSFLKKIKQSVFVGLLLLLAIADLLANGYPIAIAARADIFTAPSKNFELLKSDQELNRFFYTPEMERESRVLYGDTYSEALLSAKDNFAANWHIPDHLYDYYGYASIKPLKYFANYHRNFSGDNLVKNLKSLSLFNVKYIVSHKKLKNQHLKLLREKDHYGIKVYLYQNKKVLPRAYFLNQKNKPDLKSGQVEILKYQANKVIIYAELKEAGHLFLADTYYPGWKAIVNGKEKPIVQINDFFRGVRLPAGNYNVVFVYDPASFKLGALISLMTVLGLVIFAISRRKPS